MGRLFAVSAASARVRQVSRSLLVMLLALPLTPRAELAIKPPMPRSLAFVRAKFLPRSVSPKLALAFDALRFGHLGFSIV
jgi:hypothetical protein